MAPLKPGLAPSQPGCVNSTHRQGPSTQSISTVHLWALSSQDHGGQCKTVIVGKTLQPIHSFGIVGPQKCSEPQYCHFKALKGPVHWVQGPSGHIPSPLSARSALRWGSSLALCECVHSFTPARIFLTAPTPSDLIPSVLFLQLAFPLKTVPWLTTFSLPAHIVLFPPATHILGIFPVSIKIYPE